MTAAPDNDLKCLNRVRGGDSRAYSALVDRHKDRALTVADRLLGNRQDAEEIVQDAFVKAYRNLGQFRGEAKFSTWLYRIVYNLCLTRLRKKKERFENLETVENILSNEPSVTKRIEQEELSAILRLELDALPVKFKAVILLFYIQEMSYEEIASVTDMPLGTVKTHLHRGRLILRRRLSQLKGEVELA